MDEGSGQNKTLRSEQNKLPCLEGHLVPTSKQSDAPLFSELEDLGAYQGKSWDYVVAETHSKHTVVWVNLDKGTSLCM